MYATAPTTETFIARPQKAARKKALTIVPGNDSGVRTPLRSTDTDIDAWARHASAANGFGQAVIGSKRRPGARSGHEC